MARRSVETLVERFVREGGTHVRGAVAPPAAGTAGSIDSVNLKSGEKIAADRFVFALGPWLPKTFPELLSRRIVATRQEVFFFAPPPATGAFFQVQCRLGPIFNGGDSSTAFRPRESRRQVRPHTHGASSTRTPGRSSKRGARPRLSPSRSPLPVPEERPAHEARSAI